MVLSSYEWVNPLNYKTAEESSKAIQHVWEKVGRKPAIIYVDTEYKGVFEENRKYKKIIKKYSFDEAVPIDLWNELL